MKQTVLAAVLSATVFINTNSASAALLYGTDRLSGDIYLIDTEQETLTLWVKLAAAYLYPAKAPLILVAADSPNGNAFDIDNDRFYFTSFEDPGCPADPLIPPSELYFVDLSAPEVISWAGTLSGHASNGTFYEGELWYIKHGTNELMTVAVDPNGFVAEETIATEIWLTDPNTGIEYEPWLSFGDIEFDSKGVLYVSAAAMNELGERRHVSGTVTLEEGVAQFAEIGEAVYWGQIAFGKDGWMYGHDTTTGDFFIVDTVSGIAFDPMSSDLRLTDLASCARGKPKMAKKPG
jgi:hypothetical protein